MKLSELELLIDKYLSGQATDEEKAIINNWLQHNPGDRIGNPRKKQELITAIWGKILTAIDQPDGRAAVQYSGNGLLRSIGRLQKKYMIRVAASLLFVAMAGILVHYFSRQHTSPVQYASITAGNSTAMQHLLPDGSKAWLFPGSSIQVPANFNERNRHVQVTGRAFFDVKEDLSKPFFVDAGALQTRVLGTSFEVNTLHRQSPAVVVRSGRVSVLWEGKELSQLSLNKRITIDLSGEGPRAITDSVNAASLCTWWSGAFNFEQTPVAEVLQNLEQWYRYQISIEGEKWKNEKLTMQVETLPDIHNAMRLLCETLGAHYKMNGQVITIY